MPEAGLNCMDSYNYRGVAFGTASDLRPSDRGFDFWPDTAVTLGMLFTLCMLLSPSIQAV